MEWPLLCPLSRLRVGTLTRNPSSNPKWLPRISSPTPYGTVVSSQSDLTQAYDSREAIFVEGPRDYEAIRTILTHLKRPTPVIALLSSRLSVRMRVIAALLLDRVEFVFDNDKHGKISASKAASTLELYDVETSIIYYPANDPADLLSIYGLEEASEHYMQGKFL